MSQHRLGEHARDLPAGRGAADAEHTPPRVAALEPELLVEVNAEVGEVDDPCGRFLGQHSHGRLATEPAAGGQRVRRVQCRGVVRAGCRRDAALREPARAREDRALRDEQHARLRRRAQRSVEPCDTAPDDDQVVVSCKFPTHS